MCNLQKTRRKLSVYEKQQLYRANLTEEDLLSQGEMPVEYLTGQVDFAGLSLSLNRDVLIPRVETEELVDLAEKFLLDLGKDQQKIRVLEIGTGSGAISLALLAKLSQINSVYDFEFYLSDLSPAALSLAKENYQKLIKEKKIDNSVKINFIISDLMLAMPQDIQLNLILANLPYIPSQECLKLPASVKDFEPPLALDGGDNGFVLINQALKQIMRGGFLSDRGQIILEAHESHSKKFIETKFPWIMEKFELSFYQDQFERQRFIVLE